MRKISKLSANAFMNAENFKLDNTSVTIVTTPDGQKVVNMYLFGNLIATRFADNPRRILISNCGYKTKTTKDRLNALPNVYIRQSKGQWFLNGKEWESISSLIGV